MAFPSLPFAERFRRAGPGFRRNVDCGQRPHNRLNGVEHPAELPPSSALSGDRGAARRHRYSLTHAQYRDPENARKSGDVRHLCALERALLYHIDEREV